jgi:hypothetical protein
LINHRQRYQKFADTNLQCLVSILLVRVSAMNHHSRSLRVPPPLARCSMQATTQATPKTKKNLQETSTNKIAAIASKFRQLRASGNAEIVDDTQRVSGSNPLTCAHNSLDK